MLIPVKSSSIDSIGYNTKSSTLIVKFKNGGLYAYSDVPAAVHQQFMNASSHGQYLDAGIRDVYSFQRINESDLQTYLPDTMKKRKNSSPRQDRVSIFNGLQGAAFFI